MLPVNPPRLCALRRRSCCSWLPRHYRVQERRETASASVAAQHAFTVSGDRSGRPLPPCNGQQQAPAGAKSSADLRAPGVPAARQLLLRYCFPSEVTGLCCPGPQQGPPCVMPGPSAAASMYGWRRQLALPRLAGAISLPLLKGLYGLKLATALRNRPAAAGGAPRIKVLRINPVAACSRAML